MIKATSLNPVPRVINRLREKNMGYKLKSRNTHQLKDGKQKKTTETLTCDKINDNTTYINTNYMITTAMFRKFKKNGGLNMIEHGCKYSQTSCLYCNANYTIKMTTLRYRNAVRINAITLRTEKYINE